MAADLRICGHQTQSALFPDITLTCELPIDHKKKRQLHQQGHTSWGELTAEEAAMNPHADPFPTRCGHQSLSNLICQLPPHHSQRLHQQGTKKWGQAPDQPDPSIGVEIKTIGPLRLKEVPVKEAVDAYRGGKSISFPPYEEPEPESKLSRLRAWINPHRALGISILVMLFLTAGCVPSLLSGYSVGQSLLIALTFLVGILSVVGLVALAVHLLEKE